MKNALCLFAVLCMTCGCFFAAAAESPEKGGSMAENTEGEVKLLCLNIGKADCLLLFCGETRWLIDTGYEQNYNALETALAQYGVDRLDGVFLTHCHDDHEGGLLSLARSDTIVDAWYASSVWYDVKENKHPAIRAARECGEEAVLLSAGDVIPAGGGASFTVLGPLRTDEKNENNNSLVMLFSSPAGSILLCGDMKTEEEADLLAAGNIAPCTLLKAGHHGGKNTLSDPFLAAVRPEAAVISTSTAEEPDTPAPSTLRKLENAGCAVYVTQDFRDAVLFTLSGGKVADVEDISWNGVPPRFEGLTMDIRFETDTVTLTNTAAASVSLDGYTIYSTKGDETLLLEDLTLAPGESRIIGGRNASVPVDQTWDEKYVWSNKKRDVGILYDPWGRPVAAAENGLPDD